MTAQGGARRHFEEIEAECFPVQEEELERLRHWTSIRVLGRTLEAHDVLVPFPPWKSRAGNLLAAA